MSAGRSFKSHSKGKCGACGEKYVAGDQVRRWDEALCHAKCLEAELGLEPDEIEGEPAAPVVVFRGHHDAPVAVPREVVLASERPFRAYELHQSGLTWEAVALQEDYPTGAAARADVQRYMREAGDLVKDFTRKELLITHLAALRKLQSACWNQALEGNLPAIAQAHSLIITQTKLLRLDQDTRDDDPGKSGTVIVPAGDDEYSATLKKIGDKKG